MKLLVLAQIPPPLHGQSRAVERLLAELRREPGWQVFHVNLRLSRNSSDIGRWRGGKIFSVLGACLRSLALMWRHGRMTLYYVPAPAKRGALYRDWLVLALCRPWCRALVLHWHAIGLGEWLGRHATALERWITRRLLGRAALALVQAEAVRADAELLGPLRCVVARNGVLDPAPDFSPRTRAGTPFEVVFAGLGCREKGLFDALEGVLAANRAESGAFRFTAVGPFASAALAAEFERRSAASGGAARHLGFVTDEERNRLFATADAFCFPSYYPHEGQPAALLEALAHDLPIITTRWRGIPETLPAEHVYFVAPRAPDEVAARLAEARRAGPPGGRLRGHFLAHFTVERHHTAVLGVLRELAVGLHPRN